MSDSDHEEEVLDLSKPNVVNKYKAAAEIANGALAAVLSALKSGAKKVDLAILGDKFIEEESGKQFKGKKLEKGLAFPTCISVNNIVGHVSPQADDSSELKDGDLVKIDLGAHIDGFIAVAAHSVLLQGDSSSPAEGQAADALQAANTALEAALRLIRPGKLISEVAPVLQKIVEAYGCNLVEGVFTHEMKQYVIDGNKCILNKPTPEAKVAEDTFEENEVYAVDIVVSTGEGKSRIMDEKETTVYKRIAGEGYKLKLNASRKVLGEIIKKYPSLPFSLRNLEVSNARMGLPECVNHDLLQPYPVLYEKPSALVAQFKATVLLLPGGSDRITSAPLQELKSERKIEDEEIKKLLQTSLKPKKKSAAKKAAKKSAPASKEAEGQAEPQAKADGKQAEVKATAGKMADAVSKGDGKQTEAKPAVLTEADSSAKVDVKQSGGKPAAPTQADSATKVDVKQSGESHSSTTESHSESHSESKVNVTRSQEKPAADVEADEAAKIDAEDTERRLL